MAYQICNRCIMDTTDPDIYFDQNGVCNHCHSYDETIKSWNLDEKIKSKELEKTFEKIRLYGKGRPYDSILGLSGGVDSSYVAKLAVQHGLRPLVVHLDNGWNSELAVANIYSICKKLNLDLYTHVIDWDEFRDLQRSFFKAHVVDIEILSDHAIFATILNLALKHKIKYMLSGANIATECVMPKSWVHRKSDWKNIKSIHKKYGEVPLKTFPRASTMKFAVSLFLRGFKTIKPLNYIDYNKDKAIEELKRDFNWKPYPGKHYESIFTKFYQAHILPKKFNIDKRKAHYASLVLSGQMSREEALNKINEDLYPARELKEDQSFVLKKLGFTEEYFNEYILPKRVEHGAYGSDERLYQLLYDIRQAVGFRA